MVDSTIDDFDVSGFDFTKTVQFKLPFLVARTHVYTCICIYIYTYTCVYMYVGMYACTYVCIYVPDTFRDYSPGTFNMHS